MSESLALYIHWPFCVTKCPYCDFNSHVRAHVDDAVWQSALLADLAHEAALTPHHRLTSIFFGGGTPSLMPPETVAALITAAKAHWPSDETLEITLEANPSSVEASRFTGFAAAGVNRLSLGLQALDDDALRLLGRPHNLAEGLAALDIAQAHFPRVSFDLIYDRPGMTVPAWDAELTRALGFGTSHISLYQLTIEPGTRFATLFRRGELTLPDPDTSADLFTHTRTRAAEHGLHAYEVSNLAHPGMEARHNLQYWTYGDYIGIGPGAHGRRLARAATRIKKPENWLRALQTQGHGIETDMPLTPQERATEALVMGLRLATGINRHQFERQTETPLPAALHPARTARLVAQGLLIDDPQGLRLTPAGQPLVDAVLREIAL